MINTDLPSKQNHGEAESVLYNVKGRVQGVGFRRFVEGIALDLGLSGYVENLDDGTVEILAQGPKTTLQEFKSRVRSAPRPIVVKEMLQTVVKNSATFTNFNVR